MIVKVLELESRNELVEQSSTFVDLSFEQVSVAARLEGLSIAILLDTLYARRKTSRTAGVLRITLVTFYKDLHERRGRK